MIFSQIKFAETEVGNGFGFFVTLRAPLNYQA